MGTSMLARSTPRRSWAWLPNTVKFLATSTTFSLSSPPTSPVSATYRTVLSSWFPTVLFSISCFRIW
eukprot:2475736-Rhodomonas_salina.1